MGLKISKQFWNDLEYETQRSRIIDLQHRLEILDDQLCKEPSSAKRKNIQDQIFDILIQIEELRKLKT
jgi:hypothetical protein